MLSWIRKLLKRLLSEDEDRGSSVTMNDNKPNASLNEGAEGDAIKDLEARVLMYSENIQQLSNLKMKMVEFIETRDLNILGLQEDTLAQVTALMKEVYRDFHEEGRS